VLAAFLGPRMYVQQYDIDPVATSSVDSVMATRIVTLVRFKTRSDATPSCAGTCLLLCCSASIIEALPDRPDPAMWGGMQPVAPGALAVQGIK
jgi:hypothetical protein